MARRSTIRRFCGSSVALVLLCSIVPVIGGAKGGALALRTAEVSPDVAARLATADPSDDVTVIVRMRDRASLAAARNERTPAGRQRAAIVALRSTATRAQRSLRKFLDAGRAAGTVASYQPLWILDAVSVTAKPEVISRIAARRDVESISPDSIGIVPTGTPGAPPEPNVAQIGAPAAWAQGHDGEGVVVASLDSGVDAAHPDLAGAYRGGEGAWFDPYGQHPTVPFDPTGHGTATMGVIVGGGAAGTTIGVAPGATWIAARVFDDAGNATATAVHAALQWALDPDGDPLTADAPAVVNNSWSYPLSGCFLEFQPDVEALRSAGVIPVFAAGNFGPYGSTSTSPANYPEALSVGAVDGRDRIWSYSSRGPTTCGGASTTFPDLVAPGVSVRSTDRNGLYTYWSGTSISAPAVSGALAVLLSSQPTSELTPEEALLETAKDLGSAGPDDKFGHGRIDIGAALEALDDSSPPPTTTTTTTLPPTTLPPTTTTTTTTLPPTTTTTTTTLPPTTTTTTTTTLPPTTTTTTTTLPPTTTTTTTTLPPTTTTTTTTLPPTTTTTTTVPTGPPGIVFADDFESGSTAAWTSAVTNGGLLSVAPAAALEGSYGLRAEISNTNDLYVLDTTPSAATSYNARFRFDPNDVSLSFLRSHELFVAASGTATAVVEMRSLFGWYQVRVGARLDNGSTRYTSWTGLTDDVHVVELGWVASSGGGSNGTIRLWIDGAEVASATALANGAQRVDDARLGPQSVPSRTSGVEYFDGFVSTLGTYIGP